MAYRDVFTLLLRSAVNVQGVALERLRLDKSMFHWWKHSGLLEGERSSPRTRNHRLAACMLSSDTFRRRTDPYASMSKNPRHSPATTRSPHRRIPCERELADILAQPDLRTRAVEGMQFLLSVLYDTGRAFKS